MKRTLIVLFTLIVSIAAIAQPARPRGAGRPDGPPPEGMRGPRLERLAEVLALTDAQEAQADAFRATLESTVRPLFEQQRANHDAIEAAIAANDANAAGKAVLANAKLREQIKAAHDAFKTSLTSILTAEQKAKFEMLDEMRGRRRERP